MSEEKTLFNATVCYPVRGDEILLAMKTMKIGAGCWNGYGGGIEKGETPLVSIVRELKEESNVIAAARDFEKVAVMKFHNTKTDGSVFVCVVHFYFLRSWEGEFRPTEEMVRPTWFRKDALPLGEMMPADRVFLPLVISGKRVVGMAKYGPFQKELLGEVEVSCVESFLDAA